jgi:hypothetical protein
MPQLAGNFDMFATSGQASSSNVCSRLSISRKIILAQLAIVLSLEYTALKLTAIEENPIDWWT